MDRNAGIQYKYHNKVLNLGTCGPTQCAREKTSAEEKNPMVIWLLH